MAVLPSATRWSTNCRMASRSGEVGSVPSMVKLAGPCTVSLNGMIVTSSRLRNCAKVPVKLVSTPARPSIARFRSSIRAPSIDPLVSSTKIVWDGGTISFR
jgi:hypothetical protein